MISPLRSPRTITSAPASETYTCGAPRTSALFRIEPPSFSTYQRAVASGSLAIRCT